MSDKVTQFDGDKSDFIRSTYKLGTIPKTQIWKKLQQLKQNTFLLT